jgi:hypothetical protein
MLTFGWIRGDFGADCVSGRDLPVFTIARWAARLGCGRGRWGCKVVERLGKAIFGGTVTATADPPESAIGSSGVAGQ